MARTAYVSGRYCRLDVRSGAGAITGGSRSIGAADRRDVGGTDKSMVDSSALMCWARVAIGG
jgi:hypothetical protein